MNINMYEINIWVLVAIIVGLLTIILIEITVHEYPPMTYRQRMKRAAFFLGIVALGALLFMIFGCASTATMARQDGFNMQVRGWQAIQGEPAKHDTVITVRIIVTDDLPMGTAATYSHPQGIIRIRGKLAGGKIIVPEVVIGHEILHALQFQGDGFINPDKLTELGY